MRWVRRFVILLVVLAAGAVAATLWMGLEFGDQPTQALTPASDVKFVDANGIHFAYLEEGTGPLVLLMHGYPETARSWAVVQHKLAAAGYRVVAPYMRGYPPSGFAADGNYSVATLGQDITALIDALGESKAIVVGHDWGASAAYAAATAHPEKVTALVTIAIPHARAFAGDPTLFLSAPHFVYYQAPWSERLVWSRDFAHIDSIYRQWASPTYTPTREVLDDIKSTLRAPGAVQGALSYYWGLFKAGGLDPKAGERTISVPSLVIAGADDGAVKSDRFAKARGAFLARYEYVEIPNAGHFPQLEAGDKTADAIIAFLKSEPAPANNAN
jgi:pimeloyl-ACP methyl ester carboxylesterase